MNIGLRLIHEKMYITTKIEYQFHNLLSCINMVAAFIRQNMINFLNPIYLNTLDHICELRYNMTIIKNGGKQMEAIRPSSDLRNHYNEISKQCHEERNPVIITVNGRGDTAILGLQDYYQMKSELELLRTLAEAENDVVNGRVTPMQETFDDIRKSLLERKADEA